MDEREREREGGGDTGSFFGKEFPTTSSLSQNNSLVIKQAVRAGGFHSQRDVPSTFFLISPIQVLGTKPRSLISVSLS